MDFSVTTDIALLRRYKRLDHNTPAHSLGDELQRLSPYGRWLKRSVGAGSHCPGLPLSPRDTEVRFSHQLPKIRPCWLRLAVARGDVISTGAITRLEDADRHP